MAAATGLAASGAAGIVLAKELTDANPLQCWLYAPRPRVQLRNLWSSVMIVMLPAGEIAGEFRIGIVCSPVIEHGYHPY
jgi:hypothetical protein